MCTCLFVCLSALLFSNPPAEKIVVRENGTGIVHFSHTTSAAFGTAHIHVVTVSEEPERLLNEQWPLIGAVPDAGPVTWGVSEDSFYLVGHARHWTRNNFNSTRVFSGLSFIPDNLLREDLRRRGASREEFDPLRIRMEAHRERYAFSATQVEEYIKQRAGRDEHARGDEPLRVDFTLSFDSVYRTLDNILVAGVHEGQFLIWELDRTTDPGNRRWTTRDPVPTQMDGHFRILTAGDQLYFIDLDGIIFTGLDRNHRRIGSIPDWEGDPRNPRDPVLMLEDQNQDKIGFLRVDDQGEIDVLRIAWDDNTHATDFLQSVDSADLRAAIVRMAQIIEDGE